jgi:transcriptional regulator with XRE-family HTH domain
MSFSPHRLQELRKRSHKSREQLAVDVHLSWSSIYQYERGSVTPSADALGHLAQALDCGVGDFFVDNADRLVAP